MAKMVKCKTCGREIAKSAKVCPHCGAKRHKGVMVVCAIIIVITVIAVMFVLANSFTDDGPSENPATSGGGSSTPSIQPESSQPQGGGSGDEQNGSEEVEELVYDRSGLKIYFLGFSKAPYPAIGYYINLHIENTSDIDHTIQVRDVSADDIMVPYGNAIFSGEVLAGKTLNDHIWITNTEQLGIHELMSSVELKFAIYSGDDLTDPETSDTITLGE